MTIPTIDPDVMIEEQRPGYVRYRNVVEGRRWEVFGTCQWVDPLRWGPCGEGAVDKPGGAPSTRPDIPSTPDLRCSLCVDGGHLTFREL